MNDVQSYALAHPLNSAADPEGLEPLRTVKAVGNDVLVVVLAVDR